MSEYDTGVYVCPQPYLQQFESYNSLVLTTNTCVDVLQVTWKEIEVSADQLALKVTIMDLHSASRPFLGGTVVPLGPRANSASSKAEWHTLVDVRVFEMHSLSC